MGLLESTSEGVGEDETTLWVTETGPSYGKVSWRTVNTR
jgi:hypothetical protein